MSLKESEHQQPTRQPVGAHAGAAYRSPRLTVLGSAHELTGSGTLTGLDASLRRTSQLE